jgi:hypothetical protein
MLPSSNADLSQITSDYLALIVEGTTLNFVLGDIQLEGMLLTIAKMCKFLSGTLGCLKVVWQAKLLLLAVCLQPRKEC